MTKEQNIFLAKRNLVDSIWKQANLEGISITFPETQMIIEGFSVANKTIDELTTILNLKRAWQFLLESIDSEMNLENLCALHRIIGRDLIHKSGFLRNADVRIGGTNYKPKLPIDYEVREKIEIIMEDKNKQEAALNLMCFIMRSQLFFDGNKRTAMLSANKILIKNGLGILSISKENMQDFFEKLVAFYETNNAKPIKQFCSKNCIERIEFSQDSSAGNHMPAKNYTPTKNHKKIRRK